MIGIDRIGLYSRIRACLYNKNVLTKGTQEGIF
jgi:hypothetical protein